MLAEPLVAPAPEPEALGAGQVRRMGLADLDEMGAWLIQRLTTVHPEATPREIMGWLRGAIASNEVWLVRSAHCAAMAQVVRLPLERQPIATELFVFAQDGFLEEAAELYRPMASWAAHLDCSRLEVERCSDVARRDIRDVVGPLITKTLAHLRIGSLA